MIDPGTSLKTENMFDGLLSLHAYMLKTLNIGVKHLKLQIPMPVIAGSVLTGHLEMMNQMRKFIRQAPFKG